MKSTFLKNIGHYILRNMVVFGFFSIVVLWLFWPEWFSVKWAIFFLLFLLVGQRVYHIWLITNRKTEPVLAYKDGHNWIYLAFYWCAIIALLFVSFVATYSGINEISGLNNKSDFLLPSVPPILTIGLTAALAAALYKIQSGKRMLLWVSVFLIFDVLSALSYNFIFFFNNVQYENQLDTDEQAIGEIRQILTERISGQIQNLEVELFKTDDDSTRIQQLYNQCMVVYSEMPDNIPTREYLRTIEWNTWNAIPNRYRDSIRHVEKVIADDDTLFRIRAESLTPNTQRKNVQLAKCEDLDQQLQIIRDSKATLIVNKNLSENSYLLIYNLNQSAFDSLAFRLYQNDRDARIRLIGHLKNVVLEASLADSTLSPLVQPLLTKPRRLVRNILNFYELLPNFISRHLQDFRNSLISDRVDSPTVFVAQLAGIADIELTDKNEVSELVNSTPVSNEELQLYSVIPSVLIDLIPLILSLVIGYERKKSLEAAIYYQMGKTA